MQERNFVRIVALTAIVVIGGGALMYSLVSKQSPSTSTAAQTTAVQTTTAAPVTQTSQTSQPSQTAATPPPASTSVFKNGTYSATGSYLSPGGNEKIGVTVTLKNDIITSASVTPEPVSPEGRQYQQRFAQNFQSQVVGKDISSVNLTDVSGASLTPLGFDNALAKIEQQAKA